MLKRLLFVLFLLLGIGGFVAVPFIVGIENTLQAFSAVGLLCIVLSVANASMILVIPAISWHILMRAEGLEVRLIDSIRANFMSWPVTAFTPSMYVGGEPVKAHYIAKTYNVQARRVWAGIIVGKFQEIAALMLVMICAAVYLIWRTDVIAGQNMAILVGTVGTLTALFAAMLVLYTVNVKPLMRFLNFLSRLGFSKRRIARARSKIEHMEQIIHDSLIKRWRSFLVSQSIVFLSAVSLFVRPLIFFLFVPEYRLDAGKLVEALCAFYVACNLVNLFSFTPGGLGLLEAGVQGVCAVVKVPAKYGASMMIVNRICDVVLLTVGTWMLVHYGVMRIAKGKIQVDEAPSELENEA